MTEPTNEALIREALVAQTDFIRTGDAGSDPSEEKARRDAAREALRAALAAGANNREALASFMLGNSFATGPGDTHADLLAELAEQVKERAVRQRASEARVQELEDDLAGMRTNFEIACASRERNKTRAEAAESELARTREALKERPTFAVSVGHMKESHRETWLVCIEREGFKGGILNMNVEGGYITPSQHLIKEHAEYEANEWRKFFSAALAKKEPAPQEMK